ncbi:MAG: DUF72 domain-containing protein [Bacteroidia bacterium]|nr:DUF72 domain-containing protein [Bacteroidia bacterium]
MDFGKVEPEALADIDFTLPPDAPATVEKFPLWKQANKKTEIFVGCAKWGRKDWIGKIYPKGTKESDFLKHYASHFNTIELNALFYMLPRVAQIENWRNTVGKGFLFCPKFNNKITHIKRLKDAERYTEIFLDGLNAFGDTLGPAFLQLPPNYPPKNMEVVDAYLGTLPKSFRLFVELRHPEWFSDTDAFEQICRILEKHGAGSVITDAAGRRDCVHMRLTTPEAFIRFVGNGLHPTDYTRIDDWVQRIKQWMQNGVQKIYFFMHQHEELHSPELSKYLIQQLNIHCGTTIPEPVFVQDGMAPADGELNFSEEKPVKKKVTKKG